MKHIEGRADSAKAALREGTFTGQVWGDPLMPTEDSVTMNTVYFAPGSRTYWHKHEAGQVIHVSSGEGFVAERGKVPVRVRKGDTVWTPPGEEHWHGAGQESFLVHVAVSIGKTEWLGEAGDEEAFGRLTEGSDAGAGEPEQ